MAVNVAQVRRSKAISGPDSSQNNGQINSASQSLNRWTALEPTGPLLIGVSGAEDSGLIKRLARKLHPHRQASRSEATWNGDSGETGQVERSGKTWASDVAGSFVSLESRGWLSHGRGDQQVHLLENLGELPFHQLSATLGLYIVTGAKQAANAEPGPHHLSVILRPGLQVSLVEGIGLAKHDYGIGGPDIFKTGYRDFLQIGAQLLQHGQRFFHRGYHFRVNVLIGGEKEVARYPDGEPFDILSQGKRVIGDRRGAGGGVLGIMSRYCLEHVRAVLHRPGHGANMVQRFGQSQHTIAADSPPGGFETHRAAGCGRKANRTARVAA